MKNIKIKENPFLLFLPFLILYIVLILLFHTRVLKINGDESRYLEYAQNILNGFYSPPPPHISLINGPGYPILLVPFVATGSSFAVIILFNAFFYYLSLVFLFKSLQQFVSFRKSLIFSIFWGLYYNSYPELVKILTEPFTYLLITLILYFLIAAFNNENAGRAKTYILLAGITIGYLALTKIIFGYVLIFLLLGSIFLWLINRKSSNLKKIVVILSTAFIITVPYLIYTYNLTGKTLYWGSPGGDSLYWMSTPYKNEYGNWYGDLNIKLSPRQIENTFPGYIDSLKLHHQKDYSKAFAVENEEKRDRIFREIAIDNIRSNPVKYLQNCVSNLGRLLFSFPNSYTIENNKTLLRLPLNGVIVLLSLFCLILTFINWRRLFFPIKFIMFFLLLYLGASILVSAQIRMFTIIVPVLLFWIAYIFQKTVKINIRFNGGK